MFFFCLRCQHSKSGPAFIYVIEKCDDFNKPIFQKFQIWPFFALGCPWLDDLFEENKIKFATFWSL
jgi:hypothetical protein